MVHKTPEVGTLDYAKAKTHFTPAVEKEISMLSQELVDDIKNGKFLKLECVFQAIPNPEKPGIAIVDLGQVILDRGNLLCVDGGWLSISSDQTTIEKLKCLRGLDNVGLLKQRFHVIEVTIVASGKKHYALVKEGVLKALLKNHQEFINSAVI